MDGRTDGWMNGWIHGWMDSWIRGWIHGWIHGWTHQRMSDLLEAFRVSTCCPTFRNEVLVLHLPSRPQRGTCHGV